LNGANIAKSAYEHSIMVKIYHNKLYYWERTQRLGGARR